MRCFSLLFFVRAVLAVGVVLIASHAFATDCVPFKEARHHLGKTQCISGTVLHVEDGRNGVTFLDFCDDYQTCPFTVVVFPSDLRKMGDVRQLQGRTVEIKGKIEEYDGRAEIILRHPQQLGEGTSLLPPRSNSKDEPLLLKPPGDYDVERAGHYSAGKFKHPKKAKKVKPKKQGAPVAIEDPEQQ